MNTLIDLTDFIKTDWQVRPVILRGAFSDFQNPIEPDELAGLATEDFVESRVIFHNGEHWSAKSGPFADYSEFGQNKWTLVVQAVNHWHVPAQSFADAFYQLPMWQFDDVMVSFAADGGGVGPHRDRYDTFICQGSGKRHWRVGDKDECIKDVVAHKKLLHVESFTPIIDDILETGDILYIPAGYPHEGVSIGESLSFSVGLQSISSVQLFSDFADYLIDKAPNPSSSTTIYQQVDRRVRNPINTLSEKDILGLTAFLKQNLDDQKQLEHFLGQYFSEARHELDMPPVEHIHTITAQDLMQKLERNCLVKVPGLKCLSVATQRDNIYVNGERYLLQENSESFIDLICTQSLLTNADSQLISENIDILTEWVNLGFYYFNDDEEIDEQ